MDQLTPAIIVDLDGTLANHDHRLPFIKKDKPDWDSYHQYVLHDSINPWCKTICDWAEMAKVRILIVSGRMGTIQVLKDTHKWLDRHEILKEYTLLRKPKDFRPDHVVKKEMYENRIKDFYKVLFVLDDRGSVVKMWRKLGLVCLQCSDWEEKGKNVSKD